MTDLNQPKTPQPNGGRLSSERPAQSYASTRRRVGKRWTIAAVLGLAVALLAVVAVACGDGDGGSDGAASPTPPVADGSPAASPTGEAALPAPCQALASLETYRYVTEMLLESPEPTGTPDPGQPPPTSTITQEFTGPFSFEYNVEASVVAPDRLDAYVTGNTSPMYIIIIGDQNWVRTGTAWNATVNPMSVALRPLNVCASILPDLDLAQAQPKPETLEEEGVDTLHYTFSQVPSRAAERISGPGFGPGGDVATLNRILDVELWLAQDDNRLVRIEVQSTGLYADGRELRFRIMESVTDANDDSIRVEPPL